MEGFMMRVWAPILPGWRRLYEPQVGVSTPCRTASTSWTTVFIPGSSELHIHGRIDDPGIGHYPSRMLRDLDVSPGGNSRRAPGTP